ncbi:hypothetical protein GCM10007425_18410 [Lysinibacillus alkalisoli]|uniref:Hyaluronan synthase n=1 Tax=Lysinibacillus alkalisoli TaxID=1911548 RepID=A0A917G5U1_9BACI|nr:glycosyltransferase [Lysinibacillus alkalisoli]GGG24254.1 hypothetical protein GCM10007425_18410 [Lysinibacillus alkalisoli]
MAKKKKEEVLLKPKQERRLLPYVIDPSHVRTLSDRRGDDTKLTTAEEDIQLLGIRYEVAFDVLTKFDKQQLIGSAVDISTTGILVKYDEVWSNLEIGNTLKLKFKIPPGTMPEGYESKVIIEGKVVRMFEKEDGYYIAYQFDYPITHYLKRKRWGYSIAVASLFMLFVTFVVVLMRTESVIYFKYNKFLYAYSIIAATFLLSRYLFGVLYKPVKVNPNFEPGVTVIIPCFNEEEWIQRTILSCMNQKYPIDQLEVIVVDDCSTDASVQKAQDIIARIHAEGERFKTKERLSLHVFEQNKGKREAMVKGVEHAKHDLVVFVDSDSFLDPNAIRQIVQPFQDTKMGGVAGRTDVENKFTNALTKLQTVRYYIAFRIMKAAESWFDSVTCLSGPLSCYRKDLIIKNQEAWLTQTFLGQPATFGDDRSMTNYILKTHRTSYQDTAICTTVVPSDMSVFLKQQMRWKRSWLRESLRALGFIFRKEPFMALFFIVGLIVPIAAPIIVVYNLLYVPLVHHVFPTTFLLGLLLMALLMSFAHLFYKKSTLWAFGIIFVLYYEFILLWQMPVAWVTFWKSTWGTRETPQDIEARLKKEERRKNRKFFKRNGRDEQ